MIGWLGADGFDWLLLLLSSFFLVHLFLYLTTLCTNY